MLGLKLMRKLAKILGVGIIFILCLLLIDFFLPQRKISMSTYLDTPGLTDKQKRKHIDGILLSYGQSTAYGGRFLDPVHFATNIHDIIYKVRLFPEVTYLINLKRQTLDEINYIAQRIIKTPIEKRKNLYIYGNIPKITAYLQTNYPTIQIHQNIANQTCRKIYPWVRWVGYFPDACKNTTYFARWSHPSAEWKSDILNKMNFYETQVFNVGQYFSRNYSAEEVKKSIANGGGRWVFDADDDMNSNISIRNSWRNK